MNFSMPDLIIMKGLKSKEYNKYAKLYFKNDSFSVCRKFSDESRAGWSLMFENLRQLVEKEE